MGIFSGLTNDPTGYYGTQAGQQFAKQQSKQIADKPMGTMNSPYQQAAYMMEQLAKARYDKFTQQGNVDANGSPMAPQAPPGQQLLQKLFQGQQPDPMAAAANPQPTPGMPAINPAMSPQNGAMLQALQPSPPSDIWASQYSGG